MGYCVGLNAMGSVFKGNVMVNIAVSSLLYHLHNMYSIQLHDV